MKVTVPAKTGHEILLAWLNGILRDITNANEHCKKLVEIQQASEPADELKKNARALHAQLMQAIDNAVGLSSDIAARAAAIANIPPDVRATVELEESDLLLMQRVKLLKLDGAP